MHGVLKAIGFSAFEIRMKKTSLCISFSNQLSLTLFIFIRFTMSSLLHSLSTSASIILSQVDRDNYANMLWSCCGLLCDAELALFEQIIQHQVMSLGHSSLQSVHMFEQLSAGCDSKFYSLNGIFF